MGCLDEEAPTVAMEVRDLRTKSVIIYAQCAEVKRHISVDVTAGTTQLLIKNLSPVIERQSIRVEGQSAAVISHVQYEEVAISTANDAIGELEQLELERQTNETRRLTLDDELCVLRKRLDVLDGVANQIGHNMLSVRVGGSSHGAAGHNSEHAPPSSFLLSDTAMDNLTRFLDYYAKSASHVREQLRTKEAALGELNVANDSLDRQIDQLRCRYEYDGLQRNLIIVIEATEAQRAELFLIYQTFCATWRPTYDVRASTSTAASELPTAAAVNDAAACAGVEEAPHSVELLYYGLIEQNTDECWTNAEIVLSTATPIVGGVLAPLPTLTANFQQSNSPSRQRNSSNYRKLKSSFSEEDGGFGSFEYNDYTDAAALQRLTIARSNSENEMQHRENMTCTFFPIADSATVPSDGLPHRVVIAHLAELAPTFRHETNASKAASALLSARITNTSELPLLQGQASVFLNNSFICQQNLRTILPNEQFNVSLGVDPAVKIEYRPTKVTNEKIGFVSKSTLTTHEQSISVRNAKVGESVQLMVREPLPKSMDAQIRVTLVSPDLRSGRTEACTKDNHVEWSCRLRPGEQRVLTVKYTIEFPLNQSVVFNSVANTHLPL